MDDTNESQSDRDGGLERVGRMVWQLHVIAGLGLVAAIVAAVQRDLIGAGTCLTASAVATGFLLNCHSRA